MELGNGLLMVVEEDADLHSMEYLKMDYPQKILFQISTIERTAIYVLKLHIPCLLLLPESSALINALTNLYISSNMIATPNYGSSHHILTPLTRAFKVT